jgi:hypothetical protein
MKYLKLFFQQVIVLLFLFILINGLSWILIHLRDDATFFESNKWQEWEKSPTFKNKIFAKELEYENQKIKSVYHPFTIWNQKEFKGKYIKTNEFGERNSVSENFSKKSKVIRLFGGSTMWGVGASDDSTIAAFLQNSKPNTIVYNHGMQGYNSRQSLERLITLYQTGESADLVIFYEGVNEISMCAKTISIPGHFQEDLFRQNITRRNTIISPSMVIYDGFKKAFINNTVELCFRLHKRIFEKKENKNCIEGYICKCDDQKTAKIAKMLIENWKLAKLIVESKGGKFIAILQPVFSEGSPNIGYLREGENKVLQDFRLNYTKLYSAIRDEIEYNKVDWIFDFTEVLNSKQPIYLDYCHINGVGNASIVNEINNIIK